MPIMVKPTKPQSQGTLGVGGGAGGTTARVD